MNKSTMIAAIFAASAFSAFAADVYSSNIVGYTKVSTGPQLNLIGLCFQPVGGNGTTTINDTISSSGLVGFDWDLGEGGDQMYIWDATAQGYAFSYTYAGDSVPEAITTELGYDLSGKWMDGDLLPVSVPADLGSGIWIESSALAATVVLAGEVSSNETVTVAIGPQLNLVANPYPTALNVNSATYTGLVGFDWDLGEGGDQMYVWDAGAQGYSASYTYAGDSVPEAITTELGYDLSGKWMDGDLLPVSTPIPVGGAMWIQSTTSSGSVTFDQP